MSKLDWTRAGLPNPDPAGYNPDRELRLPSFKEVVRRGSGGKAKAKQRGQIEPVKKSAGPRKMLAEVLRLLPDGEPKKIGKRIRIVEQSGKPDANAFIHRTAIMILEHTKRTGDCTAAMQLIDALPAGARRKRLALWFREHSPICYSSKTGHVRLAKPGEKAFKLIDIQRAWRDRFA